MTSKYRRQIARAGKGLKAIPREIKRAGDMYERFANKTKWVPVVGAGLKTAAHGAKFTGHLLGANARKASREVPGMMASAKRTVVEGKTILSLF